ncbi:MAG: hypothetical protein GY799_12190 [Desulfobulbaceae bacterium]|nr:hypothetical protein [Desulfobulbaceae bacterium]
MEEFFKEFLALAKKHGIISINIGVGKYEDITVDITNKRGDTKSISSEYCMGLIEEIEELGRV